MMEPIFSGFLLGASLIIAIGAQNAFILQHGLARKYVFTLCTICALSDALLIVLGVGGFGLVIQRFPQATQIVTWCGIAFLVAYGAIAFRRALHPTR